MENDQVRQALIDALHEMLECEAYLLEHDVNERSISHKLAEYLRSRCDGYNVDCEYNRNMDEPKRVHAVVSDLPKEDLATDAKDTRAITVYPDVIVHRRGKNDQNLLVVEMKKLAGRSPRLDYAKLRGFCRDPYYYRNAALVLVGWNEDASCTIKWVLNGHDPTDPDLEFEEVVVR